MGSIVPLAVAQAGCGLSRGQSPHFFLRLSMSICSNLGPYEYTYLHFFLRKRNFHEPGEWANENDFCDTARQHSTSPPWAT
jgi:hypothetical protein